MAAFLNARRLQPSARPVARPPSAPSGEQHPQADREREGQPPREDPGHGHQHARPKAPGQPVVLALELDEPVLVLLLEEPLAPHNAIAAGGGVAGSGSDRRLGGGVRGRLAVLPHARPRLVLLLEVVRRAAGLLIGARGTLLPGAVLVGSPAGDRLEGGPARAAVARAVVLGPAQELLQLPPLLALRLRPLDERPASIAVGPGGPLLLLLPLPLRLLPRGPPRRGLAARLPRRLRRDRVRLAGDDGQQPAKPSGPGVVVDVPRAVARGDSAVVEGGAVSTVGLTAGGQRRRLLEAISISAVACRYTSKVTLVKNDIFRRADESAPMQRESQRFQKSQSFFRFCFPMSSFFKLLARKPGKKVLAQLDEARGSRSNRHREPDQRATGREPIDRMGACFALLLFLVSPLLVPRCFV